MGADKLDPGNYKPGLGAIRAIFAAAAAEFGDEAICEELLRQLDEEFHPVFETKTGSLKNKGLSTIEQGTALRARLGGFQDWVEMVTQGPPECVKRGPILTDVAFPDVLVAKAYSHDGKSLDLVLYPGVKHGEFDMRFENLQPEATYAIAGQEIVASKSGVSSARVVINGRTALGLSLR